VTCLILTLNLLLPPLAVVQELPRGAPEALPILLAPQLRIPPAATPRAPPGARQPLLLLVVAREVDGGRSPRTA
jgi:hypothetical protein